ncbi:MAG: glutathione S-transferase C-terminal domain-containing protein [Inhella sp.]
MWPASPGTACRSAANPAWCGAAAPAGRQRVRVHLRELEQRLAGQDFLFGAQPQHADFSAFHGLWFLHDLARAAAGRAPACWPGWRASAPSATAAARRWRVSRREWARCRPRRLEPRQRLAAPKRVAIGPADYAQDQSEGLLVAATPTRWVLARDEPGLGRLHVHFPRQGYRLVALD